MNEYSRCAAYIDMAALKHNISEIKRVIKPGTKVLAVIKADAYGHGAVPIAREFEKLDYIWGFAVAAYYEAEELRKAGITKPILILGVTFASDYKDIIENDVRPAIFSYKEAKDLSNMALSLGKEAKIHIKTDTGMGRIGYPICPESADDIQRISDLPNLTIEGIFTHFSKADEKDLTYAGEQFKKFNEIIRLCNDRGVTFPIKHCSNSAGIMVLPEANMDMVRAGIILYGLLPSNEIDKSAIDLKSVMTLKSRIVHIKTMEEGSLISYGGTYKTKPGDVVATVSFGYADGYPRTLSGKGYVLVRGRRAPIIGRVCMDQFMINVRDIPGVSLFDPVTLVGRDGDQVITMEELGDLSGRFNYEFACDINMRVPRIYI